RRTVRNVLVGAEAAVALMLLVGAGVLIHSFWNLLSVDPGFDPSGVAALQLSVPNSEYTTAAASANFYQRLRTRIRAVPGVESAGATTVAPLSGGGPSGNLSLDGSAFRPARIGADFLVVTPGYFAAMRIPVLRGRAIDESDKSG